MRRLFSLNANVVDGSSVSLRAVRRASGSVHVGEWYVLWHSIGGQKGNTVQAKCPYSVQC